MDLREEAAAQSAPTDEKLQRVSAMAAHQVNLEVMVDRLSAELKEANAELKKVSEESLPALMLELGLKSFELADGSGISINPKLYASITKAMEAAAFAYLKDTGNDSIIKNEVKTTFGKGEDDAAQLLLAHLGSCGYDFAQKRFVHHSTLPAWIKAERDAERLDTEFMFEGELFDVRELFSVHEVDIAKITKPK